MGSREWGDEGDEEDQGDEGAGEVGEEELLIIPDSRFPIPDSRFPIPHSPFPLFLTYTCGECATLVLWFRVELAIKLNKTANGV
ncbi:hypothetical protein [Nostoc favosum]|uniref:Uncharacterized protein n=1 Tax=Nostoc favosum CHAB5714 TaxID=2780399 RepID=A0ABS8I7T7_9NOSO|nr:hypothetical protein [Nostoc favosum]MCC5600096.1 hypothetical protein [Nostoc favosum CHAB5714]